MNNYLRWGFRQLYLVFFWPTRLKHQVEDEKPTRFRRRFIKSILYFLKLLPWIAALAILGNFIVGYACEALGIPFQWRESWHGVWVGAVFFTLLSAVIADIRGCVASGIALSVALSTWVGVGDVMGEMVGAVAVGAVWGIAFAMWASAWIGAEENVSFGTTITVLSTVIGGIAAGLVSGSAAVGALFSATYFIGFLFIYFRLVTYPFDVIFSTATYGACWRQGAPVERVWWWCPVAWNEMIWLPLPFVGRLLALMVRQDREEGFKRIAFVAAERGLQRRAAVTALAEVALDDLQAQSVARMADVTDRLDWTTDAPAELAEEVVAALPRFDRVAQHVGQYLTLNSAYRKREALARAVEEVKSLQRSLIAARGRNGPRLLQVANEWRRLLDEESKRVKALPATAREIPNPFVYGNAVVETEHNVFTGRRDVVRQIEASLLGAAQAPTLLLQGPRRMGKTSILNQLPRLLGPDFAPAVVDCQNPAVTGSEATLLRYLSRALGEGLRRRRVTVEALTAAQVAREPYAAFDEWLERVERAMPAGMRALLCLDEYERLQSALAAGWGGPFLDSLRHTFQHRPRVVLMFTGAHTFQELGPAWTDRFISARRMRVSFLRREDVELLLTKPIPEFDMTYAPGALDALVAATNCHPFLTQAVAFELVQLLNEGGRREATPADVEEAVGRALVSGDAYFVNVWGDAGAEGQAILRALTAGETPPDFPTARAWLREHDVVGADGDFAVEMMRRWVVAKTAAM